jgi:hypothetical protein
MACSRFGFRLAMLAPFGCVDCELRFFLGLDGSQDLARILGLDERNHMPGVLRSETRVNWFGGPQKLRAPNGIREPVRASRHCQYRDAILRNWFQP